MEHILALMLAFTVFAPSAASSNTKAHTPFSEEEDTRLMGVVSHQGANNWHVVAAFMPGRNARQCRDRWKQYLSRETNTGPLTPEECSLVWEKYLVLGNKWEQLAAFVKGRSVGAVKCYLAHRIMHDCSTRFMPAPPEAQNGASQAAQAVADIQATEPPPTVDMGVELFSAVIPDENPAFQYPMSPLFAYLDTGDALTTIVDPVYEWSPTKPDVFELSQ
ncbi:MAG: hypothetical protein LBR89_02795 [Holosporales bacterium]|jgi:hypothetical protein|nr:hypothetical protein [Holosporales bacterium]